jgi:small subunit ribosomal protein S16
VATKIKLMRLGKMRAPYYRVVVADSRTKRDGRSIETIGKYHPKNDPSVIEIDNERALYWLRVGAQPTEAVAALLRVTGTWQEFKGEPAPPPMLMAAPKADKKSVFEDAARSAAGLKDESGATTPKAAKPAKKVADKAAKDKTTKTADQADAEAAAEGKTLTEAREEGSPAAEGLEPAAEAASTEAPASETAAAESAAEETSE